MKLGRGISNGTSPCPLAQTLPQALLLRDGRATLAPTPKGKLKWL
jgi:hypothetical protein